MNETDIKNLLELAQSQLHVKVDADTAIQTFVAAGIMEENGEYTQPYQQLLDAPE